MPQSHRDGDLLQPVSDHWSQLSTENKIKLKRNKLLFDVLRSTSSLRQVQLNLFNDKLKQEDGQLLNSFLLRKRDNVLIEDESNFHVHLPSIQLGIGVGTFHSNIFFLLSEQFHTNMTK